VEECGGRYYATVDAGRSVLCARRLAELLTHADETGASRAALRAWAQTALDAPVCDTLADSAETQFLRDLISALS
jgi:hypothetical protein